MSEYDYFLTNDLASYSFKLISPLLSYHISQIEHSFYLFFVYFHNLSEPFMKPDFTQILSTNSDDHPKLLKIWESAVRATHQFLSEQHIFQIRDLIIQHHYFDHVQLYHIEFDGKIVGLWSSI